MNDQMKAYISGTEFSDAVEFRITPAGPVKTRIEQIIDLVKGKRVIHVGCCDHKEILEERISKNMWLHAIVTAHSAECLGIDIDRESIEFCKKVSGLDNIIYGDISEGGIAEISGGEWDIALFADVLEHIPNPSSFMKGFVSNYSSNVKSAVISVPNSMKIGNFISGMKSREIVNTDHQCEYTPFTLSKTLYSSGIEIEDIYFSSFQQEKGFRRWVFRTFPYLNHTLIVYAPLGTNRRD